MNQPAAGQSCTWWQGALGQIDDAAEASCVIATCGDELDRLAQRDDATAPDARWMGNRKTGLVHVHWAAGEIRRR